MSIVTDPKIGLIDGPFQSKLEALSRSRNWYNWAGYAAPSTLDTVEFEYFALRNQASLFDISPLHKYRIQGTDAILMLNRLLTRDVRKIKVGRVSYAIWCDEEGMVIDDGTLFHLRENDWRLCCQEAMLDWLLEAAWGFQVEITDESAALAALSLQGPTSFSILSDAGFNVNDIRPFDICEGPTGILISRTGFTGDLGYEIWCASENAHDLWDLIWECGSSWGLRAIGYDAVDIARVEAGFITAGVDFMPVHNTEYMHRGQTPFELNLAKMVDFNKDHFNGRRALMKVKDKPRSRLMRFDVGGFKPAKEALIYNKKKREVGHISSGIWSPTVKKSIALAHVKVPYCESTSLWAEIYVLKEGKWTRRMESLSEIKGAFYAPTRAKLTPPLAR